MENKNTDITKENWETANQKLLELGTLAKPYTILIAFDNTNSYGTAVLAKYKNKYFFLTPTHVTRQLKKAETVQLLIRLDHLRREYPNHDSNIFKIYEWNKDFKESQLKEDVLKSTPQDLSLIEPPAQIINTIKNYKQFIDITKLPRIELTDILFAYGGINYKKENEKTYLVPIYSLSVSPHKIEELDNLDYIESNVSLETFGIKNLEESPILNFEGLSGGGL